METFKGKKVKRQKSKKVKGEGQVITLNERQQ